MKTCTKCKLDKILDDFHSDNSHIDGKQTHCKDCQKQYYTERYNLDKNKIKTIVINWRRNNRQKYLEARKRLYQKHKDKLQAKGREYYQLHKDQCNKTSKEYAKNRFKNDLGFRLRKNLRNRLQKLLKRKKTPKRGSAIKDLGCSVEFLIKYLESQFQIGMNWDNYGAATNKWNIDHIISLTSLDLNIRENVQKVCHYTNLRPMWHIENIKKSNKG